MVALVFGVVVITVVVWGLDFGLGFGFCLGLEFDF